MTFAVMRAVRDLILGPPAPRTLSAEILALCARHDDGSDTAEERALALAALSDLPLTTEEWRVIGRAAVLLSSAGLSVAWVRSFLADRQAP